MKKQTLILITFIFFNAIAFANPPQKTTTTKKSVAKVVAAPNVAEDAIKFENSNAEEDIDVNGKDVLISGNNNKLTITGNVEKILITGKNNDITLVSVNEIIVTGSGNFISWENAIEVGKKPTVQDKGGYNNIGKRSGNAQTDENK